MNATAISQPARLRWPSETALSFWLPLCIYLALGAFFVFGAAVMPRDALARVANASRVLFSRDPHLAAIGFVWSPLPVLALLPLVALKGFWPALTELGFAGCIVSAVSMAGAVYQLRGLLAELSVPRLARLVLTSLFALHPIIAVFGANGMSEAMLLFFLLLTARQLARWIRTRDLADAVNTAVALAGAYLTRYEAVIAGAAVMAIVAGVSFAAARGKPRRRRLDEAASNVAIVSTPLVIVVIFWTATSWLITGHPLEQVTSVYGTSAQVAVVGENLGGLGAWLPLTAAQLFGIEPFVIVAVVAGSLAAFMRRDLAVLAPLGVLGSVLAFMVVSDITGTIDHELRYVILAVPLTAAMAGVACVPGPSLWSRSSASSLRRQYLLSAAAICLTLIAFPASLVPLLSARGYNPEAYQLRAIFDPSGYWEQRAARRFDTERAIAHALDAQHLAAGSVLIDDFLGFPIVVSSDNPRQFIITSDRIFPAALRDPAGAGVRYLLVPAPMQRGPLDALNRQYAAIYSSGAGIATLIASYPNVGDSNDWRLFAVRSESAG